MIQSLQIQTVPLYHGLSHNKKHHLSDKAPPSYSYLLKLLSFPLALGRKTAVLVKEWNNKKQQHDSE
jgi:hypothetical protein